jgi:hypothetical protein
LLAKKLKLHRHKAGGIFLLLLLLATAAVLPALPVCPTLVRL